MVTELKAERVVHILNYRGNCKLLCTIPFDILYTFLYTFCISANIARGAPHSRDYHVTKLCAAIRPRNT